MAGAADNPEDKEAPVRALDEDDIALLKTYGLGPYSTKIKDAESDIKNLSKRVNNVCGVKESDTGLAAPSRMGPGCRQAGTARGATFAGSVLFRQGCLPLMV